jgi:uncharacterized membrane protein
VRGSTAAAIAMTAVPLPQLDPEPELCIISRRNCSISTRTRWMVFALLASVSITVALVFVAVGAWPVLPYSVLELSVLAIAFGYIERQLRVWERLTVAGDRLRVERWRAGQLERHDWPRCFVHVAKADPAGRRDVVELRYAGECFAFGNALAARERSALARELQRLIGPAFSPQRTGSTESTNEKT